MLIFNLSSLGSRPEGRAKVANEVEDASLNLLVPASASPFRFCISPYDCEVRD